MVLQFDLSWQPCDEGHQAGMLQLPSEDGLQLFSHLNPGHAGHACHAWLNPLPGGQEGAPGCLGRTSPWHRKRIPVMAHMFPRFVDVSSWKVAETQFHVAHISS
jgi:hypothetical protein